MFKWIRRVFKFVVLPLVLLAVAAYFYPEKFLCVDSGKVSADVIIVLGGGVHERPVRAAELYQQHAASRIIITGEGDDGTNRLMLIRNGVPPNVIEVEGNSRTTQENALFTIKLLRAEHIRSAILVTSWYHARRSLKTFEHYAPEIKFYARPSYFGFDAADWKKTGTSKRMRLEFIKLPAYWIRYGVSPF